MNLVVDTSVWSLVLRRVRVVEDNPFVQAFKSHIENNDGIFLIGNILQELLDGLHREKDIARLLRALEPFPLIPLTRQTYVAAARLRQRCRSKGVQTTAIDCLIAATCIQEGYPLLTADRDFLHIARVSELVVLRPRENPS